MTTRRQPKPPKRQHKARWLLGVLVIVLVLVGWTVSTRSTHSTVTPVAAAPEPTPSPDRTYGDFNPPRPDRNVSWRVFAGISLPISATAGPSYLSDTRATGFAHTADGAAIAAAQLLVRTFPFAGSNTFKPTIAEQVTGIGAAAFARLTQQTYQQAAAAAGIRKGAPIRSTDGWVAGYRLDRHKNPTGPTASVDVLVAAAGEGSGFTTYRVDLTWQDGDWRLVAPAWGDWRSNAQAVAFPHPASYRDYDNLGIGSGGAS
jgi:hypothetical protein